MQRPKTGAAICMDCLAAAQRLMDLPLPEPPEAPGLRPPPRPLSLQEMLGVLEARVVGQEEAKEALAFAFLAHGERLKDPSLEVRPHLLLVGPTGSGKTHMVQVLAEATGLPTVHASATSFTQAGYVGDDLETLLSRLLHEAGGDLELAESGVIFLDEIDKLARKTGPHRAEARDVGGEGVQQALLRLVEGARVPVPANLAGPSRYASGERREVVMDTSRILWIFAGAFEGLEAVVQERVAPPLGFTARRRSQAAVRPTHEDLIRYGMIPELVGRIGQIALLRPLSEEELYQILVGEGGFLAEYRALLGRFGVSLEADPALLREVARRAALLGLGARGLRALLTPLLRRQAVQALREGRKEVRIALDAAMEGLS